MSKAIVLVAFGSANLEGIKQSIGLLEQDLNEYFAGEYTVLKAFTSNKIIELLKERHDYVIPHLSKALFNLVNQGYEEVIIQPLHIMSTSDIKRIEEVVDEYKYSMKRIVICNTLFSDEEEVLIKESNEIANIIWDDSEKNDILLVGHGSKKNSKKIYEDDKVLAFYDISPEAPVHFLVIPKEHISSANEINEKNADIVSHIFIAINKIVKELNIADSGYRIINNCGVDGGQTVNHMHFHVLGARELKWPPG